MNIIFKILKKHFKEVLIIGLIAVILLMRACSGDTEEPKEIVNVGGKDYELLEQKIDTVFVNKIVEVPKYVPKYVDRVVEKIVEIPADVDSLQIIKDYYSKFVTKDTLKLTYEFAPEIVIDSMGTKPNPTLGFGVITDTITQNKIVSRDILWNFEVPTIYNTKVVKELPKRVFYYGVGAGFDKTNFINNAKFGILYKDKKDKMWGLDIGALNVNSTIQPYIGGSMYWKISFKKKK